jgi:hypothetical protein
LSNDPSAPARIRLLAEQGYKYVGKPMHGQESHQAVGMIAEGDVVMSSQFRPNENEFCLNGVRAALASSSGGVTVQEGLLTYTANAIRPQQCGDMTFQGSIVAPRSPVMLKKWGNSEIGYKGRSYTYDEELAQSAPPMYPLADPWRMSDWSDANEKCLSAPIFPGEPTCR